ncbi:MAG: heat-inducible transcriptional repressor HrcA [Candidatus Methylomirabilales bacterium]
MRASHAHAPEVVHEELLGIEAYGRLQSRGENFGSGLMQGVLMHGTSAELTERQREVLRAIIQDYISSAEPVGSRSVARKYGFRLSAATIRNVMADLAELGYLSQPHPSAGRVPTDLGYRCYVDSLMDRRPLTRAEATMIERQFRPVRGEMEDLMREATRLLSALSRAVGVVLAPRVDQLAVKRIEFVHLSAERVLVILITTSGQVQHRVVILDEVILQEDLNKIARLLNSLVEGMSLSQVRQLLVKKMAEEKARYDELLHRALKLGRESFAGDMEGEVYIGGTANIMHQPEFADVEKMRAIFLAFEETSKLVKILDQCLAQEELTILIGSENVVRELQRVSLVTAPYWCGEHLLGTLGVIGPTRMEYGKIVSLVDFTANLVSRALTEVAS